MTVHGLFQYKTWVPSNEVSRWQMRNKKLVRAFWERSWFDFSQTFALALDAYSVSVLQCNS